MEPIIDPMFFYWCGLCDASLIALGITCAICTVAGVLLLVIGKEEDNKSFCRLAVKLLVVAVVVTFGLICIPTGNTLTKMVVAKNITPDNLKALQSLAGDARDSIKGDIIEIIEAVNEKKAGKD